MNPHLAKQLKDAGFPQGIDHASYAYLPRVEELIDEMGTDFSFLGNHPNVGLWSAAAFSVGMETGETAREALAKLYIKLQENKHPLNLPQTDPKSPLDI